MFNDDFIVDCGPHCTHCSLGFGCTDCFYDKRKLLLHLIYLFRRIISDCISLSHNFPLLFEAALPLVQDLPELHHPVLGFQRQVRRLLHLHLHLVRLLLWLCQSAGYSCESMYTLH